MSADQICARSSGDAAGIGARGETVGCIADFAYPLPALLKSSVTGRVAIAMG